MLLPSWTRADSVPDMEQLPGLPAAAFDKEDPEPDAAFYDFPRFVTHIDEQAIGAVTAVYREVLPPGGAVLDLMSSWVSHLPSDVTYGVVVGHGMNAEELAANSRLSRWFVRDLNVDPILPIEMERSMGCVCACPCSICSGRWKCFARCAGCCGLGHRLSYRSQTDAFRQKP